MIFEVKPYYNIINFVYKMYSRGGVLSCNYLLPKYKFDAIFIFFFCEKILGLKSIEIVICKFITLTLLASTSFDIIKASHFNRF